MSFALPELVLRMVEDASVGKIVSVVGVGFIFAVALALVISSLVGVSIMPIDRLHSLVDERERQLESAQRLDKVAAGYSECVTRHLDLKLADSGPDCSFDVGSPGSISEPRTKDVLLAESVGLNLDLVLVELQERLRRQKAGLEQISANLKVSNPVAVNAQIKQRREIDRRRELTAQYETTVSKLVALRGEAKSGQAALRQRITEATSISNNIAVLGSHVTALLVFSVLLGVVVAQVSRLYIMAIDYQQNSAAMSDKRVQLSPERRLERQRLIATKFRYAEASFNLVLPIVLLGHGLSNYLRSWQIIPAGLEAANRIQPGSSAFVQGWLAEDAAVYVITLGCTVIAILLFFSAFRTYLSFRRKDELLMGLINQADSSGRADTSAGADGGKNAPV